MKKVLILPLFLSALLLSGCSYSLSSKEASIDKNYSESSTPYANTVSCTLKLTSYVSKDKSESQFMAESVREKSPLPVVITDLNTDSPKLIGNAGEETLIKVTTTNEPVYMIEKTGAGYINVWTLYRDKNILMLSKQYNIAELVNGYIMIGDCLPKS